MSARVLMLILLGATGCESAETAPADLGMPDLAPAPDASAGTVTVVGGWLKDSAVDGGAPVPVAGAQMCVVDHPEIACGTTTMNGVSNVEAPANSDVAVQFTDGDLYSMVRPVRVGTSKIDIQRISNADKTTWNQFLSLIGQRYDATKGNLVIIASTNATGVSGPVDGVTVTASPASGTLTYADANGLPSTALTATSSSGLVRVFNMTPGMVDVTVSHPQLQCTTLFGWTTGPNTFRTRVLADARTFEIVECK
jgi:hypothetical protein